MKLTLTQVFIKQQVSAKTGKPYTSLSLKATEYGDRFISGFGSKESENWKAGDVVEVEVTESEKMDRTGKPYLNWKLQKKEDITSLEISRLQFTVAKHEAYIRDIQEWIKDNFTKNGKRAYMGPNFGERPETPEEHREQSEALSDLSSSYIPKEAAGELESLDLMAQEHFAEEE